MDPLAAARAGSLGNAHASGLLTDLYELTMMHAAWHRGMQQRASFEFFVRELPEQRNFLVAAGLQSVIDYLQQLHFSSEDLAWVKRTGLFDERFVEFLGGLRFTGDVYAMPEGTVVFPDEPLLRVVAPLPQAQLVESRVMNLMHYSTLCASKAARCVLAARGRPLVDFGLRRAHGAEAGLLSARASYIAGFSATATAMAGKMYGIPVAGTMAHSFVQAHEHESEAFMAMVESSRQPTTLLVDTYDTAAATSKAAAIHRELKGRGHAGIRAVRIDSGDLGEQARMVRAILDNGQCQEVHIVASGNLDEYQIDALCEAGAPINEFGVGTRMNTSADAPYLDCAYKLVDYGGRACRKTSIRKAVWPGAKQVWRQHDRGDQLSGDELALQCEPCHGTPLLEMVMHRGERVSPPPALALVQAHVREQLASLPAALRNLHVRASYPVRVSPGLERLTHEVDHTIAGREREDAQRWGPPEEAFAAQGPGAGKPESMTSPLH